MVSILQLADSRVGAVPAGVPARRADLLAGLSRAVDAAIDLDCDAIVHSGGLVEHDVHDLRIAEDVHRALRPAFDANVRVIASSTGDGDELLRGMDGLELLEIGDTTDVNGITVANAATDATDDPRITTAWGRITGIAGIVSGAPELDAAEIAALATRTTWVAAGGVGRYSRIAPRAAYAPATAQANSWEAGDFGGGVLIEVDPSRGAAQTPRVTQVVWPDRPRASVTIDAGRMDTGLVAAAIVARLAALQELAPAVGPLSLAATVLPPSLRGRTSRGPASPETSSWYDDIPIGWWPDGMAPWDRPVVSITVRGALASLTSLRLERPTLDELLTGGTQLMCSIRLGEGGWTHVHPDRELEAMSVAGRRL